MKTVSGAFVIVATLAISALVLTGGAYSLTSSVDISGNQMLSDGYALDIYSDTEGTTLSDGKTLFADANIYYRTVGDTVNVSSEKGNVGSDPNHSLSAVKEDRYLMISSSGSDSISVECRMKDPGSGEYVSLGLSDIPPFISSLEVVLTNGTDSYSVTLYDLETSVVSGKASFEGLSMVPGEYYAISVDITLKDVPVGSDDSWKDSAPSFSFIFAAEAGA